jgi:hypothetical protein
MRSEIAALLSLALLAMPPTVPMAGDTSAIVGNWSFDGTCASDMGMTLSGDGTVSYAEIGAGLWAQDGRRLVLIVRAEPEFRDVAPQAVNLIKFQIQQVTPQTLALEKADGQRLAATRCAPSRPADQTQKPPSEAPLRSPTTKTNREPHCRILRL